ncbi:protein NO VEIN-LIKE-like [Quercus robur]|uniref:protein NO VEIN-LIKE-like n=1 Tax=Quercus robur TaxID=38942 RepID=UPI002163BE7C|nr:protein NO VEIN-LIKE-like [Quercus robur]
MEKVDRAVTNARRNIIAAGESVTAWKVSQDALLILNLDSWSSLGFPMQEVPSLHRLMLTEGKINAFIHCFVGVQRVTTLYDLEVAICKNEGVDNFEKLELGPLLRHPLVLHYFSLKADATEVFKITGEEVFCFLWKYIHGKKKKKSQNNESVEVEESLDGKKKRKKNKYINNIQVDKFLNFIAKRRSVASKEELCIRIQNLGMHVSAIQKAMSPQTAILKKPVDATSISQRVESFSSARKDFRGKNIRFASSSSNDDEDSDDSKDANLPSQNVASSDRVTSCP